MTINLRYFNICILILVVIVLIYTAFSNGSKINSLEAQIGRLDESGRSRREIQKFFAKNDTVYSKNLCSNDSGGSVIELCKVLKIKSFERLSDHTDLWVALDGIAAFSDFPQVSKPIRREITRYYIDLVVALDVDGAWSFVTKSDDFNDMISTNKLYDAIIGQAVVCREMPKYRNCFGGMTLEARRALKSLSDLVLQHGSQTGTFEMSNRLNSIQSLYDVGLFGSKGKSDQLTSKAAYN